MELSYIVFLQVMIIFVMLAVGFFLAKKKIVSDLGLKQITDILLYVVTPCVIVNAYRKEFSAELLSGLLIGFGASVIIHIIAIQISTLVYRKDPLNRYRVKIFSSVYSNCGYMAIPLLSAALGSDGVFFGSAYLAVFTVFTWTHGICIYRGDKKELSFTRLIKNPGLIGVVIALTVFLGRINLPYVIGESITHMANLNTALAMIIMGSHLAKTNFKKAITKLSVYGVCLLRLIIIPLISMVVLKLLPVADIVAKSVLITAACPTAAISTLFAAKYDMDAEFSAEIVAITTVLSIITIPLILLIY